MFGMVGRVLSAPKDFLHGMGGGWKLGLLAAGVAAVAGLAGLLPAGAVLSTVIGAGVGGTMLGGVAGGTINMVKEFFTSAEGKEMVQQGIEQVIDTEIPSQARGGHVARLQASRASTRAAENIDRNIEVASR